MIHSLRGPALLTGATLLAAGGLRAQSPKPPQQHDYSGSGLFHTYCASCHGVEAKGDGPLAEHLRVHPTDLTQLARRNDGQFPAEKVQRIIDGRNQVKGHGGGDMPVWGDAFKQSLDGGDEASIKAKIAALVEYLQELQAAAKK